MTDHWWVVHGILWLDAVLTTSWLRRSSVRRADGLATDEWSQVESCEGKLPMACSHLTALPAVAVSNPHSCVCGPPAFKPSGVLVRAVWLVLPLMLTGAQGSGRGGEGQSQASSVQLHGCAAQLSHSWTADRIRCHFGMTGRTGGRAAAPLRRAVSRVACRVCPALRAAVPFTL